IQPAQARPSCPPRPYPAEKAAAAQRTGAVDTNLDPGLRLPFHVISSFVDYSFVKNSVEFTRLQKTSSSASLRSPTFSIYRLQMTNSSALGFRAKVRS